LQQGRRKIAFIGTGGAGFPEVQERWSGYCRALRAAGIEPDERLRADAAPNECEGRRAVAQLLESGAEFDAIFAASDVAAIGAMHALQQAGRAVPQTAVVGFDDIPAASLASPPLTTVTQDSRQAAEALIDTLIESIEAGAAADRILPVRLTVRESSVSA
jgi:DNA-binding LacI/PurR family transcriptional regulator